MATKGKARKARATVPDNETADQKFIRLANKRVSRALNDLKLIGNLARYSHSPEAAAKITNALAEAVEEVISHFGEKQGKAKTQFSL